MSAVQTAQYVAQGLPSLEKRDREEGLLSGQLFELQPYLSDLDLSAVTHFTLCFFSSSDDKSALHDSLKPRQKCCHYYAKCSKNKNVVIRCNLRLIYVDVNTQEDRPNVRKKSKPTSAQTLLLLAKNAQRYLSSVEGFFPPPFSLVIFN